MHQTPEVSFPSTKLEVEIVLPIPFSGSVLRAAFRCVRILLCESMKGLQDDNQATHQEISSNLFDLDHYLLHSSLYLAEADGFSAPDYAESRAISHHAQKLTQRVVCNNSHSYLLRYNHSR